MATGNAIPQSNEFAAGAEAALKTAVHLLTQLQTKVQKASAAAPPSPLWPRRQCPPAEGPTGLRGVTPRATRP